MKITDRSSLLLCLLVLLWVLSCFVATSGPETGPEHLLEDPPRPEGAARVRDPGASARDAAGHEP